MKSTITDTVVKAGGAQIEESIASIEALVNPNTPALTPEDRMLYGRGSGNANKLLVADVVALTKNQPSLRSNLIDWDEFTSDNESSAILDGWISRIKSIVYKLESAKMMHDYDNYNDAIDQYAHLDYLSRNNVQGASEAHRQLKEHFKRAKSDTSSK